MTRSGRLRNAEYWEGRSNAESLFIVVAAPYSQKRQGVSSIRGCSAFLYTFRVYFVWMGARRYRGSNRSAIQERGRKLGVDLAKLITYGNCLLYLIATYAFSKGIIEVSASDQWQSENSTQGAVLIGLLAFSILMTISCFLGLLLRKDWGRKAAFLWSLSLALIFGVVPFGSILIVYGVEGLEAILNAERLIGILVGVLLVVFALGLRNRAVIDYFKNENRSAI